MSFEEKYKRISRNKRTRKDFESTNKDRRVYTFINVNCRGLLLYYDYLFNDQYTDEGKDKHHIIPLLKRMNLFADINRDKINEYRVNILDKIKKDNNLFKKYFIVLMSLGTNEHVNVKYMDLINTLSPEVTDYLYNNIKDIKNDRCDILNPLYGYLVFYNERNDAMLNEYLDSIGDTSTIKFLKDEERKKKSLINLRVDSLSEEFFKDEMEITGIIKSLIDVQFHSAKTRIEAVNLLVNAIRKYALETGLYAITTYEWKKLKDILSKLTTKEYNSFIKPVINALKCDEFTSSAVSLSFDRGVTGEDVIRKTKARKGQNKFKNSLIAINKMSNKGGCKCSIERCKICNSNFLIASHIKEWNISSGREKVDGYNGLLLCPTHDYLFDKHLITFNTETGVIKISKRIDKELYGDFNIKTNDSIRINKNQKKYLKIHNNKLK